MSNPKRISVLAVVVCGGLALIAQQLTMAASKPMLALPKVSSRAEVSHTHSGSALLVRSLSVRHDPDVGIRVSCGGCSRLRSPLPRVAEPTATLTRYLGLEWIVRPGHHVQVIAVQSGAVGRYLLLGVREPIGPHSLRVIGSGCINGQRQRISCPHEGAHSIPNPEAQGYPETAGGETHTHANYSNASGAEGPVINEGQTVQVSCRVEGMPVEDKDPWWYRIASSPWSNRYYASADAFYNNGQTTGSLEGTPFYDPAVPVC